MDVAHPDLLASLAPPQPQQQPQTVAAGGQPVFDTNGQFWVKPLFMQVLRSIPGTPPNKVVFSYKEVCMIILKLVIYFSCLDLPLCSFLILSTLNFFSNEMEK